MTVIFFMLVTLGLMLLQTVLFPLIPWIPCFFDHVLLIILLLSLSYTHYLIPVAIVFIGAAMDSLSGGYFFFHIFSYLWVFIIVQILKKYVFQKSVVFVMIISLLSVMIQQAMILFILFLVDGNKTLGRISPVQMMFQWAWAVIMIPIGIWVLNVVHMNYLYVIRLMRLFWERRVID